MAMEMVVTWPAKTRKTSAAKTANAPLIFVTVEIAEVRVSIEEIIIIMVVVVVAGTEIAIATAIVTVIVTVIVIAVEGKIMMTEVISGKGISYSLSI